MNLVGRIIVRAFKEIPRMALYTGAVCVICMAILLCYDVSMRYFFNSPKGWAIEIAQFLMLATFFLPLAYVQHERRHIKVELFISHLPFRVRTCLSEVIIPLIALAVNCVVFWQVGSFSLKLLRRGTVSATTLRLPFFPFSLILVFTFFAVIIVILLQFKKRSEEKNEFFDAPSESEPAQAQVNGGNRS